VKIMGQRRERGKKDKGGETPGAFLGGSRGKGGNLWKKKSKKNKSSVQTTPIFMKPKGNQREGPRVERGGRICEDNKKKKKQRGREKLKSGLVFSTVKKKKIRGNMKKRMVI